MWIFLKDIEAAIGIPAVSIPICLGIAIITWLHMHHVNILDKMWDKDDNAIPDEAKKVKQTELIPLKTYHDILDWFLGKLKKHLGEKPWGPKSYDWCLRWAVAYPIASIFVIWSITGENTSGIQGFLPDAQLVSRLIFIIGISLFVFGFYKFNTTEGWKRLIWLAFAAAFAAAFAGAAAAAAAGAVAVAFAFAFAVAVAVAFAVAVAVAVAVAFAGAVAVAVAILYLHHTLTKRGWESISHINTWVFYISVLLLLSYFSGPLGFNDNSRSLLVFLATLPLINVVFDWLSLGVTRHLLQKTLEGINPIWNSLLDLLAAIIILIALAITTIAFLQLMNILAIAGGAKEPMINLANILQTLRARPWDVSVWWIYIILFSTLLPTFVHAMIATGHLVTMGIPKNMLEKHRKALEEGFEGDYPKLLKTARTMTLRRLATVLVFAISLCGLTAILWTFALGLPQLAQAILYIVEATASAMGVEVTPVYQKWWVV